jgi:adenine-specific DNA-methyltransferase
MRQLSRKESGAYYTPEHVAESLLRWAIRASSDRLLDPSCGDGQFLAGHKNSVGIEQDTAAAQLAMERAPGSLVHEGDFFTWAGNTTERFDCAVGNPPFIRYQTFKGNVRDTALALCARRGAHFTGLTSSWAPFLVAAADLLREGGRMAFVVPAEIGHAPYAAPLVEYLVRNFSLVHIVAVREKLFPHLSEDCWLLYADGHGSRTSEIRFTALPTFGRSATPPSKFQRIPVNEWRATWGCRLRPYLLSAEARDLYQGIKDESSTKRFGEIANVGIGYVTGANDFFHLRPSEARRLRIPSGLLHPTVRKGSALPRSRLTRSTVDQWHHDDEQMLLLRIPKVSRIPAAVDRYLDSEAGHIARQTYKCRGREPWYSVPDVQVPDYFLSYMSGLKVSLVRNEAECTCTNSVHSVRLKPGTSPDTLSDVWESSFVTLSSELEGHPLGGGMLKLEPREAASIVIPCAAVLGGLPGPVIDNALSTLRQWRHHAAPR